MKEETISTGGEKDVSVRFLTAANVVTKLQSILWENLTTGRVVIYHSTELSVTLLL